MFDEIHLKNYKSYSDQVVPLRPVTVLCGANSSGKTAILKSLLLLKQSFEATRAPYLLFQGEYVDSGSFQETLFAPSGDGRIGLAFSFQLTRERDDLLFRTLCQSIGMTRRRDHFQAFSIQTECSFQRSNFPPVGEIHSLRISLDMNFSERAIPDFKSRTEKTAVSMTRLPDNAYRISLENFPLPLYDNPGSDAYPFVFENYDFPHALCYFSGLRLNSLYQDGLSKRQIGVLPVLYTLFQVVETELGKVKYLGPLREGPHRTYPITDVFDRIGVKGEWTAQYLSQFGDNRVFTCVPPEKKGEVLQSGQQDISLNRAVTRWMKYFECDEVYVTSPARQPQTQIMIGEQNIMDVGFGVSQALPVVVAGLILQPQETLMIEQPEVHLHPKMQWDVADFLLSVARQGRQIILETHSDHMVNRIVRRALEDPSIRDMIRIYFVSKQPGGASVVTEIPIDPELGFDDVPEDFFTQYNSEAESIFNIGYRNMNQNNAQESERGETP